MQSTLLMRTLTLSLLIIQLSSCSRTYEIPDEGLNIIPYQGNEVLVFRSNTDDLDTIFLTGFREFNAHYDPLAFFQDIYEGQDLTCTRTDPNYNRYLAEKSLMSIAASDNGGISIKFDIAMKRSWFYDLESYSLDQLNSIPNSTLEIGSRTYSDVKVFNASDYAQQFSKRDNYTERFYWSVAEGFLGLDRTSEQWRLILKYVP